LSFIDRITTHSGHFFSVSVVTWPTNIDLLFLFFMVFYVLLCPDLRREGHYEMRAGVCLSVRLSVCRDSTTERPRKPKIGVMEVHHTSNPLPYLEVKSPKPINAITDNVTYGDRREFP